MASGLSPRSVARSIAAIRGFYRFLVLDRRIEESPADDLTPPRAWPALPKFLSVEEVDGLIAQPAVWPPLGLRDGGVSRRPAARAEPPRRPPFVCYAPARARR